MSLKEAEKLLHNDNKFIFMGEEQYLGVKYLEMLKSDLNPDFLIFNYIEIDQEKESCEEAIMKIESVPMMDRAKLVHITNFNFTIENNPWSKAEINEFEKSLESLSSDTRLVISNFGITKAGNLGLFKSLTKIATLVKLDRLKERDLRDFIKNEVKEKLPGNTLSPSLIEELLKISAYEEDTSVNLYNLKEMLTKAGACGMDKGPISEDDLYRIFEQKKKPDIFRLLNTIRDKDKPRAFAEYKLLIESGDHPLKVTVSLAKMLSTMVKASYYYDAGYSVEATAKELGKHPFAIKSGLPFVKKYGRKKLIAMLDQILSLDYRLKTGNLDEEVLGELVLLRIFDIIEN